jgi:hypothetical protein
MCETLSSIPSTVNKKFTYVSICGTFISCHICCGLPSKYEALSSNSSSTKKKKRCEQNITDWMTETTEVLFWRLESPRLRCWLRWFLVKVFFLACRWLLSDCLHSELRNRDSEWERDRTLSSFSGEDTVLIRAPPSWAHLTLIAS